MEPVRQFIDRLLALGAPRLALAGAVFLVAFIAVVAAAGGFGGGEDKGPTVVRGNNLDVSPTPRSTATATAEPTSTSAPAGENRADCTAIAGSEYRSDDERSWFFQNCGGAAGGPARAITGPAPAPSAQVPTGDRLVINGVSVNASVYRATVGSNLAMPDPVGYFNAVSYDFPAGSGLGGNAESGNLVLSGHVDCARCVNGGSGLAIFYYIRNLQVGATAQYVTASGSVVNYVVTSSYSVPASTNFIGIVASDAADMTLITCTGTFSGGEYNLRHVVALRKQ
jgi:hypothetical protein